jgi:hypothetical protein
MSARDFRTILAGICLIGFGLLSNLFKNIGAEKWQIFAMIVMSLAAIYIGLDLLIATETSLIYRISSWISVDYHKMGALMVVVVFFALVVLMSIKLVNLPP